MRNFSAFSTCSMVPAIHVRLATAHVQLPSAHAPGSALMTRSQSSFDTAKPRRLNTCVPAASAPAGAAHPTEARAFWFSVVQLYIFWALPCALLRSREGFASFSARLTSAGANAASAQAPDL